MIPLRPRTALAAVLLVLLALQAAAQGRLFVRPQGELLFPLDSYTNSLNGEKEPLYSTLSLGAGSALDCAVLPWLRPFVRGEYVYAPYEGGAALGAAEGDLGLGLVLRPTDRLSLRIDAMGGLASLQVAGSNGSAYAAGARLGVEYRLAPAFSLCLSGGYSTYIGGDLVRIFSAIVAGLCFSYDLSAIGGSRPRLAVEDVKLDAVFPSLYAYYDDNAFGSLRIVNREDSGIRDVRVSFYAGHYMDQPKVCGTYAYLSKGDSRTVPVRALFTDSVLGITQGTDAKAEIIVQYSYLGSEQSVRAPVDFRMHHRNAITWSDDRRAGSFVSPTNPAALWFSKFAAGIVRGRLRGDINKPLQYAVGMFEAERLYGLNYVVVPANDYSVKHGLKDYIDSAQFPHQTLTNRGGDCSDLAILFATLMQAVGIEAAFITIPGHIFAAFDTGLGEAEAREKFYDSSLLVIYEGRAWIPVEITMVKDGFIKAWRVASKEWADNSRLGQAAFYSLSDCWKVYPSAAFPGVNPRFVLPDEAEIALAFDSALDRFLAREIGPKAQALQAKVATAESAVRANELGILYANYGMLKASWKAFSESAMAGSQSGWTNLGNIAYLRQDYRLALSYFKYSCSIKPSDELALLGLARCQYELEDFKSSDSSYAQLRERNPVLASKFGYLASIFGGEGRAWSLAERFASTSWAKDGVDAGVPETQSSVSETFARPAETPACATETRLSLPEIAVELPAEMDRAGGAGTKAAVAVAYPPSPAPVEIVLAPWASPAAENAVEAETSPGEILNSPTTAFETPPAQVREMLLEGFSSTTALVGTWSIADGVACQNDPEALFAKLSLPLEQGDRVYDYSFTARSEARGRGWVGLGFHVCTTKTSITTRGFGSGRSLCVWLTRDPVHYRENQTRLQLYRSRDDWNMDLLAEVAVSESIYEDNRFDLRIDSVAGSVSVSLNGSERLAAVDIRNLGQGAFVLFRALDRACFSKFKAEAEE